MKIIGGDAIKLAARGDFDVLIHGCNCFNTMGAGIAKSIKEQYPGAFDADCGTVAGNRGKLGRYSSYITDNGLVIINAYTQYGYDKVRDVDYEAVARVFAQIKKDINGESICYPMIGCGLAGGSWDIVGAIINEELKGEDHTLVVFPEGV